MRDRPLAWSGLGGPCGAHYSGRKRARRVRYRASRAQESAITSHKRSAGAVWTHPVRWKTHDDVMVQHSPMHRPGPDPAERDTTTLESLPAHRAVINPVALNECRTWSRPLPHRPGSSRNLSLCSGFEELKSFRETEECIAPPSIDTDSGKHDPSSSTVVSGVVNDVSSLLPSSFPLPVLPL